MYAYDGDGNRVSKIDNSDTIHYLNDINLPLVQVVMETHIEEEERVLTYYTIGNDLISMNREDDAYLYHYDAFGTLIEGNNNNPYGFTGERQFNEATGLIFLRARYYDPEIGRFISRDPILLPMMGARGSRWFFPHLVDFPQTFHPYVYVHNNPVNFTDPTGLKAIPIPPICIVIKMLIVLGLITWGGLRALCRGLYRHDKLREAECELADMPPLPEELWADALRRFCKRRGWYGPVDIGDILPLPGPEIP